ncbi:transposase [Curtobacterium flaccumfaciens]|uniref:transposase n=1 Tax=Curtobacterium flaccumfaciens TaxID=2035 RepID=UPI001AD9913E|nr:transposase [Curtobacterium flaccumfaciens]MBO9049515.1 transposase [Curtobacterium flaccumfaciens pv. flaccumfaciens]
MRIPDNREAILDALAILAASSLRPILDRAERLTPGRPRSVSFATTLAASIGFKVQSPKRDVKITDIARWVRSLTPQQQAKLGFPSRWTYFNLQTSFKTLAEVLEPAESDRRINADGTIISVRRPDLLSLDEFANALLAGSWRLRGWKESLPWTRVQAIDSTDIETHARARAWTTRPDSLDEYEPDDSTPNREWNEDPHEWPKVGHLDGRKIVSADLQARIGWRTKTDGRASNAFNGYDAHLLVDAGNPGSTFWVPLIRGVAVRPAGSYKAQAGLDLLDSLHGGIQFDHLTADRGYSHARSEAWAKQLTARGLKYVHDLHASQRRPHPSDSLPGAFWLDGTLFPTSLPTRMRKLPGFKARTSRKEREALLARYDERAQWAFVPNRRFENGDIQYKGPARAGHLRCPNYPPSARLGAHVPRSNCVPGEPCACAATKVIPATEGAWERQQYVYGTTKWAAYYGLRNMVESQNAQLKYWRGSMRRHSTHVFGTTANTLVLVLNCIAVNISMLRDAYGDADPTRPTSARDVAPQRRRKPKVTPTHLRPRRRSSRITS